MLPSMPILFTRDSQDAFGNKIQPSTSFFGQNNGQKTFIVPAPRPPELPPPKPGPIEAPKKADINGKEPQKVDPNVMAENVPEAAQVAAYYHKVQCKFASNRVPDNKFVQFRDILQKFDPTKETPIDLYKKIEEMFGEEHKYFAEEFLMFLTPGQAVEMGRFMDYFTMIQLSGFIQMLQSTFSRKPAMLRKILRAINNSLNCGTLQEMRAKVLPHLRTNPRLVQMFKSLFPDERPPDSLYENATDVINETFLENDQGFDVWEIEDKPDADHRRNLDNKQQQDSLYLQGRVFLQHGRNLRPARVTFPYSKEPYRVHARRLAPAHCRLSSPDSDTEKSSPKRKNTKTNSANNPPKRQRKPKAPKHLKDVNDNTKSATESPKGKGRAKRNKPESAKAKKEKAEKNEARKPKQPKMETIKKTGAIEAKNAVATSRAVEAKRDIKTETVEVKSPAAKAVVEAKREKLEAEVKSPMQRMETVETKKEVSSWTRDEDKTMLQIMKGEAVTDQVFSKIKESLPHRSVSDIKDRFFHVMNLLQQMAVGEVT